MSRNYELDKLKAEQEIAFQRKQEAFQNYKSARDRVDTAHDTMQSAWEELVRMREKMNQEFETRQSAFERHDSVWEEYGRIRDYNNSQIELLKHEADDEHYAMQDCFERASDEYAYGDKAEAPIWSQEGYEHKARRDELNAKISELAHEVKSARAYAEACAPKADSSAFECAQAEFQNAKSFHESARAEFMHLKAERDRLKDEFDSLQAEYIRCRESFQKKLEELKTNNRRERDKTLDKAGIYGSDRKDAKIVKKDDGTTQVYHGGIGKGDGLGHGHTVIDDTGKVTYDRKSFESHGKQNFTDKTSNWTELYGGTIGDQPVLVKFGIGDREGHTLIADNVGQDPYDFDHPDKQGNKTHNHYGPKSEGGGYFAADRGKYTGPGH